MKKRILHSICFLFAVSSLLAQTRNISGTVTNAVGDVLTGATVVVKGTIIGTSTDEAGLFRLDVPEGYTMMVVSYLGYADREVEINEQDVVNIMLEEAASALDEVIVVGFGTQSKRRVTSAISSVGEEVFKNVAVGDFQNGLQGRMPGVVFSNISGLSNSESIIRIRGIGSISAGNQPLVVLDGLILSDRNASPDDWNTGTNPLININPNDIESVEVLKDAAAASIYGSRGSNGVILITTKRGKFNSPPKVHLGYYAGFSEASNRYELLNGPEFAMLWNQAAENAGYTRTEDPELFYANPANQPSSDWQALLLRKGIVQEVNANVSGGTETTQYYIGGSARDEEDYLIDSKFKRYSVRANIDQKIGEKVRAGISLNPSRVESNRKSDLDAPFYQSLFWYPNIAAFDANGDPLDGLQCTDIGDCALGTPLVNWKNTLADVSSSQILFNSYLSYSPLSYLTIKTEFGSEYKHAENAYKYNSGTWWGPPWGNTFSQETVNYNWTTLASYTNTFAQKHDLEVSAGFNLTKETLTGQYVSGSSYPDDRLIHLGAAATITGHSSTYLEAGFTGLLSRINYAYDQKYLLSLSARYDGSSRFGAENRYGFFPAVSAGWIISKEDFFSATFINFLKFRSSFGVAGNAEIGDFSSRGLVAFGQNYNGAPGYAPSSIENEALSWEKNVQWDAGLEFELLQSRIRGSLGYYIKDTKDLLLQAPVPATNGFTVVNRNVGAVRNQGFEMELSADILKGSLHWAISLNAATLKNEVLKLADNDGDGEDDEIYTQNRFLYKPGQSIGTFYLVEYAGVDPDNGDALFWNADKTEKLANEVPSDNRRIVGNSLPDFTGGFSTAFQYKNVDLSAFFQFKTGYEIYLLEGQTRGPFNGGSNNIIDSQNSWTPENPNSDIPEARLFEVNGHQRTSRNLYPGDHLRLSNLSVGYTMPSLGQQKITLRLFAAAQNLWIITDFPGLDPDTEVYSTDSADQGAIIGNPPAKRTYTFGVNMDF